MCGIVGIRRFDGAPVDVEILRAMTECLAHRGPDDQGLWTAGSIGFGHTRLSIIDVSGSRQPMTSADGRFTIAFNGEILNYREIRAGLPYPFRTDGDTETLLTALATRGDAALDNVRGQYAYALFDGDLGELRLVRDRLGILPLYYYADARMLAFASEVKALLPALPSPHRVDERAIGDYLVHRAVPAPDTLFEGIKKVRPGHVVRVDRTGRVAETPYWTLPEGPAEEVDPSTAVANVRAALERAVDEALVADVPVGAYLSGGLDSSLITALMVKLRDGQTVDTFSAGFGDERVDETGFARQVSEALGTRHHEVTVAPAEFTDLWSKLTWHRDGPLSEPADVAVFRLASLARRDVKVVLSGEGSDELFAGYPKYRFAELAALATRLPAGPRGALLGRAAELLPGRGHRARIAALALAEPTELRALEAWFAPFTPRVVERAGLDLRFVPTDRARAGDAVDRMLRHGIGSWLPDNLLERGDRMSMAASLELRPPFLDRRLVELAFRLPSSVKARNGVTKWIVKEVARGYLPASIVDRQKSGVRVPLDEWFRGSLEELAWDLLAGPGSFATQILDRRIVERVLRDHRRHRRDESMRIFTLLGLEVWHDRFFRSEAGRAPLRKVG